MINIQHYRLGGCAIPEYAPTCPKCKARSGDDWKQCEGSCPMAMSPHYDSLVADAFEDRPL